jgi:CheY-like chemotaxis protein
MRCLLVDDEDGIRLGLAALLRLRGHEVLTAADRASALELLAGPPFDLLLTDWRLPDGDAAPLIARANCPVVAASGHPEEVAGGDRLVAVLGKPVLPARLFEVLAEVDARRAAPGAAGPPAVAQLPLDVRAVVERALQLLGGEAADGELRLVDDGAFVTLAAPWPGDHLLPAFTALGGDLRILAPGGRAMLEQRWCRDGRPELEMPVVVPAAPWPAAGDFAVDLDRSEITPAAVQRLVDAAAAAHGAGRRVCFLNVPPGLRAAIEVSARGRFLPMSAPIGPRLPAALVDLWS